MTGFKPRFTLLTPDNRLPPGMAAARGPSRRDVTDSARTPGQRG